MEEQELKEKICEIIMKIDDVKILRYLYIYITGKVKK